MVMEADNAQMKHDSAPDISPKLRLLICSSQCQIQDFPDGEPPTYYLAKFHRKLHESEENWTGEWPKFYCRSATGYPFLLWKFEFNSKYFEVAAIAVHLPRTSTQLFGCHSQASFKHGFTDACWKVKNDWFKVSEDFFFWEN